MINFHNNHFSNEQLQAIYHTKGPALVIAGPGSGKTSVIVNRILYLIQEQNINPCNILVITFSKSAAVNMQQRFVSICNKHLYPVYFGTFHSIFFNIIKNYYGFNSGNIISDYEKRKIIRDIILKLDIFDFVENEFVDSILKQISYYKNSGYKNVINDEIGISLDLFYKIVNIYDGILKERSKIDFEDMMLLCKKILEKDSALRDYYQNLFSFILVDEFQDINNIQYEILKLFMGNEQNIFVVGDDDQSIYGFRGSSPQFMIEFADCFTDAKVIRMSCNYRSTKNIVKLASDIISENQNRYLKRIFTNNELGAQTVLKCFEDVMKEIKFITDYIQSNSEKQIAILFRTNNRASLLADYLSKCRINYLMKEKIINYYDSDIFRDFICYLKLSRSGGIYECNLLKRIINKPYRFVDSRLLINKEITIDYLRELYKDKLKIIKGLDKFEFDLKFIKEMDMFSAFHYFINVINYKKYLEDKYSTNQSKLYSQYVIVDELKKRTKIFNSYEEVIELEFKKSEHKEKTTYCNVHIMTFHASKGLEFDTVIIPDLNEGIVPGNKSTTVEEIEEERRMLYVAITRAKKELMLLYLETGNEDGPIRSRFIKKLFEENDYIQK